MSSDVVRWGGFAGVVDGVVFVLAGILILIAPPPQMGAFNSFSDYIIEVILIVASSTQVNQATIEAGNACSEMRRVDTFGSPGDPDQSTRPGRPRLRGTRLRSDTRRRARRRPNAQRPDTV